MHDWTLISILFEWKGARVTLSLRRGGSELVSVIAEGVIDLHVPQLKPWGGSVSVNKVQGPTEMNGRRKLEIQMQSGDVITIIGSAFTFPPVDEERKST